ncbi:MAG TPA: efflux RND transporter periplasmic adaptor subunit [Pyrinomonadaceae bacterium]|jgi:HlyD family secretion protein|nr:efflux RND transporter periplasmic adaptor subunit [Pyrinomonadaceae bacterium]
MQRIKLIWNARKRLVVVVAAVALAALAGFYFWGNNANAAPYLTAKVERGNLRNTVTATGTLQAVTTVQVGSQASGTISALYADFNSKVKKGQVIAQLDPSVTQAQVEQARANLQQAQAQLQSARAAVAQTHAGVAVSRAGISDARARALAATSTTQNQQAAVNAAQANVSVLKAQLDDAASYLRQEQALLQSGVIAQREYDMAQTSYKTAEAKYNQAVAQLNMAQLSAQSASSAGQAQATAQVEQAQAQTQQSQGQAQGAAAQVQNAQAQVEQATAALQLAQINLQHTTITSPIDGIVVDRPVNIGQTVAASLQAPTLFTIAQDLTQMQVIANIDQADIGLVEQAKGVAFSVDAFPGQEFKGTIRQMRLNPQTVQNVVTYNVVIDVSNPEQKLKPGMTANLTITIDERNDVIKVPNSALRFTPQQSSADQSGNASQSSGAGNRNGGASRRGAGQQSNAPGGAQADGSAADANSADANAAGANGAAQQGERAQFASSASPVLPGQTRRVWVLGSDGKPQARRIKIGLTDGASTEVVEGDLHEGDVVITGQNLTAASKSSNSNTQSAPPGFGGAPRMGGGGPRGGGR